MILTDGPSDDINAQPYMIVYDRSAARRSNPTTAPDLRATCCGAPLRDLTVQSAEAMRIGGLARL